MKKKNPILMERKIHRIYDEWNNAGRCFRQLVGKYQYIYTSKKGQISCVKLLDYHKKGDNFWEIFCLKGNLFKDVERFRTKKIAEERIFKLLR